MSCPQPSTLEPGPTSLGRMDSHGARIIRPSADTPDGHLIYECPQCGYRGRVPVEAWAPNFYPTHRCPELGGVHVQLQRANRYGIVGETHHIRVNLRGDYLAGERTQHGPVMSVTAHRGDGSNDALVFAPTATMGKAGADVER